MAIKIKDVAQAADVSIATVSYVLNNSAPVSEETRRRVLDAVARLGYRPNITARNLKASETRMIGYAWHNVLPGQTNALLDRFIYQLALAAEANHYHVLTFTQSPDSLLTTYDELIRTSRVDGFILAETARNDERISHLIERNFPFAAFGRSNDEWDFPYVDVDGKAGICMAVEHLLAMGHRRIGCLAWSSGSLNGNARFEGYMQTMRDAGIYPNPTWITSIDNRVQDGYQGTQRLMGLPARARPTAIVALTDLMAIGAMSYLEANGFRVGVDVAVTGFDDDPMAAYFRPPLTSLHQPVDEIAVKVIEMLMAVLSDQPIPEQKILVLPTLIIRGSSNQPFSE